MPEVLLRVEKVSKSFGSGYPAKDKHQVLREIDFSISPGESLALIGANGAGKTTLLKIIAALVTPDSGRVELGGRLLDARRPPSGLLGFASGEERSLFFRLSGRQNLRFFGALYGLSGSALARRIDELCETFDLAEFLDMRVDRCSSGMRARLGFARALLHWPRVLLLDEPTKSLDPAHANRTRQWLSGWVQEGNGLIFVTHLREEAQMLGTRIGELEGGILRLSSSRVPAIAERRAACHPLRRVGADQPLASSMAGRAIAFFKRDFALQASYRLAVGLDLFGMFFSVAMMLFLARMVDASKAPVLMRNSRGGYFGFFITGVALSQYLQASLQRFAEQIRQSQLSGNLEALFLSPARSWEVVAWGNLWGFVFQSVNIALYLVVAVVLGLSLHQANWGSAILVLLLSILALAPLGIMAATAILLVKRGDAISFFLTSISTLLGGVLYPIQVLPWWLQRVAKVFPLTHAVAGFRSALLDGATPLGLSGPMLTLSCFALVLGPASLFAFSRAVQWAKRNGSLAQF